MKELISEVRFLITMITIQVLSIGAFWLLYKINMNIYLASVISTTIFLTWYDLHNEHEVAKYYFHKFKLKDEIYENKGIIVIYLLEIFVLFLGKNSIGLIQSKILYSIFLLIFKLNRIYNLKIKMYIKWLVFIVMFPVIAMLIKENNIRDIYLKNPLAMLGVVTGGITALITMLIFIINFNVNDLYLGKSKSKIYLEDRVLIKFFKSGIFKVLFFIFLIITLKLCGIAFKKTYIYHILQNNKLFNNLLDIIEKYYINIGVFSFIILSLTILLAIMGNIEQLFYTINFKENEMLHLKIKIEKSITEKYKRLLYYKDYKRFFYELTEEYNKIKEDEKEKFLYIIPKFICNEYWEFSNDNFIDRIYLNELYEFLNNKYNWIQKNVSNRELFEKILLGDIYNLGYLDKSEFNNLKINLSYKRNYFDEDNCDIRIILIDKFIVLENIEDWEFVNNLVEIFIKNNMLAKDTEFIRYILEKVIINLENIDDLENSKIYKLLKNIYNIDLEKLKNDVVLEYLYEQDIRYLEKDKYKKILNLISEDYKIAWAFYKIFEEKNIWTKNVEFAFEVLYETDLKNYNINYCNIIRESKRKKDSGKLDIILGILDKSRLHYRIRNTYEFIFENLEIKINYEFEEILKNRGIDIFKFILIRDCLYKNYIYYDIDELNYFNENLNDRILINNIFYKLSLCSNYTFIENNESILEVMHKSIIKYRDLIVKNIYFIDDWKSLIYLENILGNIIKVHFKTNNKNIRSNLLLSYFYVLLNKKEYEELYSDRKFKKELYISLFDYMRINNKTLEEIIDEFKKYRKLNELEERVLKREIDSLLII